MVLGMLALATPSHATTIALLEVGLNIDGTTYDTGLGNWGSLPASVNTAGFSMISGLGSLTVTLNSPGLHDVRWFLDVEILGNPNDELVSVNGSAPSGGSYEGDEPGLGIYNGGAYLGDIFTNFSAGALDNSTYGNPEDQSLALGRTFTLAPGETGVVTFFSSLSQPQGGFFLKQFDNDGAIYASSTLDNGTAGVVPEPSTVILLSLGLAGVAVWRRYF